MTADELREQADRYRAMALRITDTQAIKALEDLANEYEALAEKMEATVCGAPGAEGR